MKRHISKLLLIALLIGCLALSGCSIHSKTLDPVMEQVLTALNTQDRDAMKSMLDPSLPEAELETGLEQMLEIWRETDPAEARLGNLQVERSGSWERHTGVYWLPETEDYNAIQLVYEITDGEGTLRYIHLGTADSAGVPNRMTVLMILPVLALILFTIIDILRKKPRKYGFLIIIALITVPLPVASVQLAIPVGSALYWCLRKQLLRKKAEAEQSESGTDTT